MITQLNNLNLKTQWMAIKAKPTAPWSTHDHFININTEQLNIDSKTSFEKTVSLPGRVH